MARGVVSISAGATAGDVWSATVDEIDTYVGKAPFAAIGVLAWIPVDVVECIQKVIVCLGRIVDN